MSVSMNICMNADLTSASSAEVRELAANSGHMRDNSNILKEMEFKSNYSF